MPVSAAGSRWLSRRLPVMRRRRRTRSFRQSPLRLLNRNAEPATRLRGGLSAERRSPNRRPRAARSSHSRRFRRVAPTAAARSLLAMPGRLRSRYYRWARPAPSWRICRSACRSSPGKSSTSRALPCCGTPQQRERNQFRRSGFAGLFRPFLDPRPERANLYRRILRRRSTRRPPAFPERRQADRSSGGPGSALFGSGPPGGTINIIHYDPSPIFTGVAASRPDRSAPSINNNFVTGPTNINGLNYRLDTHFRERMAFEISVTRTTSSGRSSPGISETIR